MSNRRTLLGSVLALLCGIPLLWGCGGGSGNSATNETNRSGQLQLRIAWPEKTSTRYLPPYAQSLFFELYLKSAPDKRYNLIVNRPSDKPSTQSVFFSQLLNEGLYVLAGAARVGADGQGATVASASVEVNINQGMNAADLTLNSTVKTLLIVGQPLSFPLGKDVTLQSGAFDPDGRALLLPSGALTWSVVSGADVATITTAGVLTPKKVGTMRVKVAETGANVSAEADVTIAAQQTTTSLANTPYPKSGADLANTNQVTGQGAVGQIAWTKTLDINTNSSTFTLSSPILGGNGQLYVSYPKANSNRTEVAILRTNDGSTARTVELAGSTPFGPIALGNNTVCFPLSNGGVVALDTQTGLQVWQNNSPNVVADLSIDRLGRLLAGSRGGLSVLNGTTGDSIATYPGGVAIGVSQAAVGADGTIYYIRGLSGDSRNGELVAVNPANGQILWQKGDIQNNSVAPVIGPNGWIYVFGSEAATAWAHFQAYDSAGNKKAELLRQTFSQQPSIGTDGTIYVSAGNRIRAYTPTLTLKWESERLGDLVNGSSARRITVGPNATLYVALDGNNDEVPGWVYALNAVDGAEKWKIETVGRIFSNLAVDSDGRIFALTLKGRLYAIK